MAKSNSQGEVKKLRVASYNTNFSNNFIQLLRSIKKLAEEGTDIFCLQEIVGRESDKQFILNQAVALLGSEWKAVCHLGEGGERWDFGTCILWNDSVLQLVEKEKLFLPKITALQFHEYLFEKLVGGKGELITRRGISGVFRFFNTDILIASVHLEHVGGMKQRNKQLRFLLESTKRKQIKHMIFAGDFNSFDLLKSGKERESLHQIFGDEFTDASKDIDWTADLHRIEVPQRFPYFVQLIKLFHVHVRRKLDYIWVRDFDVVSCRKYELEGSDHFPITAELRFKL